MTIKQFAALVGALTIIVNIALVYLGVPATVTCTVAQLFSIPAVASSTE